MSEPTAAVSGTDTPAGLPSIETVAESFKGGTASDPNIGAQVIPQPGDKPASPAPEAVVEPAKEPEARKPDPHASRFAALSRKEQQVRKDAEAAKAQTAAAVERARALDEREASFAKMKQDPLAAMRAAGVTMQDIINATYGKYEAPPEDPTDVKIKPFADRTAKIETEAETLRRELNDLKNQLAGKEQASQYQQVMDGIKSTAAADPDKFELINSMGDEGLDLVRDTMVEYFAKHQKLLDTATACGMVEKYYEDELLGRLASTKKLQGRVKPAASAPAPSPSKQPAPAKTRESPTTLTNAAVSASPANADVDKMSREDAIQYLANKMRFNRA